MKLLSSLLTFTAAALTSSHAVLPFVIDDFDGGPHVVTLNSAAPPEIALGSFAWGGAVGGVRDVSVVSQTAGMFSAGVNFNVGGYASFIGEGRGGIIYDGVAGITDVNADTDITAVDLDYGLGYDLAIGDCPPAAVLIHIRAFTDLPGSSLNIIFATSALDYFEHVLPLTSVGVFDDYYIPFFAPTTAFGAFDSSSINAIALFHDGEDIANVDIFVQDFEVVCVPETSTWLGAAGLLGVGAFGWRRMRARV